MQRTTIKFHATRINLARMWAEKYSLSIRPGKFVTIYQNTATAGMCMSRKGN